MCITAQCPDPTEVGIWWRDDATWKLYSKQTMRAVLMALLKGNSSLDLDLSSTVHPRGASYHIDFIKMEQTNRASGHKRAIKIIFPSSFKNPNSNFFSKVEHSIEVDDSMARFQVPNSCLLVIRKGNIAEWSVDGKADAVVSPRRRWGYQGMKKSLTSSRVQTHMTQMWSYTDEGIDDTNRGLTSTDDHGVSKGHPQERTRPGCVAAAIDRAAGPSLQEALHKGVRFAVCSGRCGDAVVTPGFKLPAAHIIHTIVPKYRSSENADVDACGLLERAYKSAVALASANGMRYLAFPAMACGAGGFPVGLAARVAMQVVGSIDDGVKEIHFVLMGEEKVFREWVQQASSFFSTYEP